jgi:hypothetical protein
LSPSIPFGSIGIRLDQARVDCEPFATDQPLPDTAAQDDLENATEEIALTKATVPVLRECRVIGDSPVQNEPAKPAVRQIKVDFVAEAPLRSYAEAIADEEHPDHQFGIDRRPSDVAVERRQLPSQLLKLYEPIN